MAARRILAILECGRRDRAVVEHAVGVVRRDGGFLTLVAVVPSPWRPFDAGTLCVPRPGPDELRAAAAYALAAAVELTPADVPLLTGVDEGPVGRVVRRRVEAACHDLVVVGRRRLFVRGRSVSVAPRARARVPGPTVPDLA